ncbi:MAG: hypothetical protein JXA77_18670 [Bacteroidales bacterium]|nr:hypothetical protein [Bacteroidales bacterium]MBN2818211.1 hypothetical protein [Bacteroidales bacterium]
MNFTINKRFGVLIVFVLTTIILWFVYGAIIKSPNYVFFAPSGDGLKSTFGSYYHYKFDTSFGRTNCMNYPFGESAFFADSQLLVANTLKLISKAGIDFTGNITGILNIWMIFTLLLGVIFIYLVLIELKLPPGYSIIASLNIAFLSPQIERFSGHYTLAYLFLLPLIFYLLIRYYKKPSIKTSLWCGFSAFLGLNVHGYFFAFFGILSLGMLVILYLTEKNRFPVVRTSFHLLIMLILPFVIFSLITRDVISDRTVYPWGGIQSSSYLESVFLPGKMNYQGIIKIGRNVSYYIGFISTVVFFTVLIRYFLHRRKLENKLKIINNNILNAFLYASLIALIYSLVWPFKLKGGWPVEWSLEPLLNYLGPLRQFRGTGRFSWIFYYTINFISYYIIWQWYKSGTHKRKTLFLSLILLFGATEAFFNVKDRGKQFNHTIAELKDENNEMPENRWAHEIYPSEYQAILPIPYYHVGSEVYWISGNNNVERASFIVSWKTGLPLTSVMLSRTSISQTIESLQWIYEPLKPNSIIKKLPNRKDLLVLRVKNSSIREGEWRIINKSKLLYEDNKIYLYSLPIDSLEMIYDEHCMELRTKAANILLDSNYSEKQPYYLELYGSQLPEIPDVNNDDVFDWKVRKKTTILDTVLFSDIEPVTISFWMSNMNKDLIPRTRVYYKFIKDNNTVWSGSIEVFRETKYIDNNGWGLFEINYTPKYPDERVIVFLRNKYTTGERAKIDNLLVRKKDSEIVMQVDSTIFYNNRYIEVKH